MGKIWYRSLVPVKNQRHYYKHQLQKSCEQIYVEVFGGLLWASKNILRRRFLGGSTFNPIRDFTRAPSLGGKGSVKNNIFFSNSQKVIGVGIR